MGEIMPVYAPEYQEKIDKAKELICPILSASNPTNYEKCKADGCAWWCADRAKCGLLQIW
jgi:hypothetical protein